jgi:U4/U6 small nuclear ribonucleoprotein PRP3
MVYVEGASKFIQNYKRLMLHRIAWTEAARPRGGEDVVLDNASEEGTDTNGVAFNDVAGAGGPGKSLEPEEIISLENNACYLVWEGQLRDRAFSTFKPRGCPTDAMAKEVLGQRLAGYWDQAKNWKPEEEELF